MAGLNTGMTGSDGLLFIATFISGSLIHGLRHPGSAEDMFRYDMPGTCCVMAQISSKPGLLLSILLYLVKVNLLSRFSPLHKLN